MEVAFAYPFLSANPGMNAEDIYTAKTEPDCNEQSKRDQNQSHNPPLSGPRSGRSKSLLSALRILRIGASHLGHPSQEYVVSNGDVVVNDVEGSCGSE